MMVVLATWLLAIACPVPSRLVAAALLSLTNMTGTCMSRGWGNGRCGLLAAVVVVRRICAGDPFILRNRSVRRLR